VAREEEFYVKASCDFIAAVIFDQVEMLVGIECKARVAPAPFSKSMTWKTAFRGATEPFWVLSSTP
jgi:hypothetical protein